MNTEDMTPTPRSQEDIILAWFSRRPALLATSEHVELATHLPSSSVRRALARLVRRGSIIVTQVKRPNSRGTMVQTYQLRQQVSHAQKA